MTQLRLGVLGAGIMGRRFAKAAADSGRFRIVAVADADPAAAAAVADHYGATASGGIGELFAGPALDAVYIGLPHHLHVAACTAAAAAGVHVLIDKPLCTTLEDAEQILGAAQGSAAVWGVGFSYRFRSDWRRVRQLVAAGAIGAPYFLTDVIVEAYAETPAWYWDPARGGGALQLQSHHTFDRHRWVLGSAPVRVACAISRSPGGADRSAVICAEYGGGVVASTSFSFGLTYDAQQPRTLLAVQGESGMIQLDDTRCLRLITADGVRTEDHGDDDWVGRELGEFADAVAGTRDDYPSLSDGVAALRGTAAAAEAARTGTWVQLDG